MHTESFFSKAWRDITRNILGLFNFATRRTADKVTGASSAPLAHLWGLGASYLIDAYISYRDYKYEEERLRNFFEPEIASMLGKGAESVTTDDLNLAAKNNATIAEAVKRNKTTRNLNFGTSAIAITIAVFTTSAVLAATGLLGLPAFLAGMAIGLSVFLGAETVLGGIGKKLFGLKEPELSDVSRHPALQHKLSLPSQVHFLEQLQSRRHTISQEQVFQTFITANPELAQGIAANYGTKFHDLDSSTRARAISEMGAQYGIEQLTADLNNRLIRPQELAFVVHGQDSGVPKLEAPQTTALERAQQKINELSAQVKDKATYLGGRMMEKGRDIVTTAKGKLGFRNSQVSGVVPDHQFVMKEAMRSGQQQNVGQGLGA